MALQLRQALPTNTSTALKVFNNAQVELGGVRDGGNLKEIRRRLKSISSISKITKTMKMIASSRLREAQNRMQTSRAFTHSAQEITPEPASAKRNLVVPYCTDKGLCGGLNSSVLKISKSLVNEEASIAYVGDKGNILGRQYGNKIHFAANGAGKTPFSFQSASIIADRLVEQDFDKVTIIFNEFKSAIANETVAKSLAGYAPLAESTEALTQYEFEEDSRLTHMRDLLEFQTASLLYQAACENSAAELGARMAAMDGATKNAGEIIKKLNITYNRARQAAITTELTEIISGAAAVEG